MTRRQWMWLWIWLLLFFIIFCVWNKLQSLQTTSQNSATVPVIITDTQQHSTPEHNITKDISLKITKDADIIKLAGVFPSQEAVDKAIEALRPGAKSVQKGTIIIDPKADNPKLRALISDFSKTLPEFSKAVIEYHQKQISLDGITTDMIAKKQLLSTATSMGKEYRVTDLVSYQKPPAPTPKPAPKTVKNQERNTTKTALVTQEQNKSTASATPKPTMHDTKQTKTTDAQQALNKVLKGKRITFLYASDTLTPRSKKLLDQIAKILKRYPDIRVEIGGHTDSDGTKARNMKLSQRRAYAVKLYLVQKGINSKRLVARGYGESKPLVKNDTPAHKQQNRRVEFKVIP